jgi:hypothetical protein
MPLNRHSLQDRKTRDNDDCGLKTLRRRRQAVAEPDNCESERVRSDHAGRSGSADPRILLHQCLGVDMFEAEMVERDWAQFLARAMAGEPTGRAPISS